MHLQVGGAGAGVVDTHRDVGALHLLAELVPVHFAAAVVEFDDGAGVVGIAPPVPVGAEDEILAIAFGSPFFSVGYADVPVVPVVCAGTEVLELDEQFLAGRNVEVLAEFGPPAGGVVFRAHDGGRDGDFLIVVALAGFLLRLIGGDFLGEIVRSIDGVGLEARAADRHRGREGRGEDRFEHQISGFHNVVVG